MTIREMLEAHGAVYLDRHFVYKSEMHGSGYINMDPVFTDANAVRALGMDLARPYVTLEGRPQFDTIVAPATGGIVLAYATAFAKNVQQSHDIGISPRHVAWADKKDDDSFAFERAGFIEVIRGKRVLLVEDLLTTGGSVRSVARLVEAAGGEPVGVSAVCNRGGVTAEMLGVPRLTSLLDVSFEATPAENCPLCRDNAPIVDDVGHGADFKSGHPDYTGGFVSLVTG